ncbi:uncharacterized protein LOC129777349 [Toxorhynchites rutilus septentrionalis]|uniref:uncharacterized protein LOC129777349 n=1 Tax=Toxorhynchites rutilus septentrionalis TaxID=329112 RepID=UPI00247A6F7C|nr:uncharacterized protein LOC129777349 [Toxorhynchites rutilus septentrionalis]
MLARLKAEDEERKRRRAFVRTRLQRGIRMVIYNLSWLQQIDQHYYGDNARRNIAMVMWRRVGRKALFTLIEKTGLSKPVEERTYWQRDRISEAFRDLECLARFPPEVRQELTTVARYVFYTANRAILKEGREAAGVYFVLEGIVCVSRMKWNPLYERYEDTPYAIRVPGEMFGEMSFLYGCPRTATCATATDCELLYVSRKYFERLLGPTLRLQWQQTREAMDRFQFFDNWTDLQFQEMCILTKMKSYERQQKISMPEAGVGSDYAYFVLSGECMILQCLKVLKKKRGKRVCYRLLPAETENYEIGLAKRYEAKRKREEEEKRTEQEEREKQENQKKQEEQGEQEKQEEREKQEEQEEKKEQEEQEEQEEQKEQKEREEKEEQEKQVEQKEPNGQDEQEQEPSGELEYHFIDVGTYDCGSVFGLGERIDDRSIVARERVHCMLVPRYWLYMKEQNAGNVWDRIKIYLDSAIPTREMLFKQFLGDLNWVVYRKKVVSDLMQCQRRPNHTHLLDVPLICRVEETMERWK